MSQIIRLSFIIRHQSELSTTINIVVGGLIRLTLADKPADCRAISNDSMKVLSVHFTLETLCHGF
jgi:hypothetical protein